VVDKRDSADASTTRRRRECATCARRFTTYERAEVAVLTVVKRDRRRQEFDPQRLRHSVALACTKRPISADTINRMVEQVEAELRTRDAAEVPSRAIGDLVMEKLRQIDHVAYIRFASVYREFADISSFEDELRNLLESPAENDAEDEPTVTEPRHRS
jgi:transcriptional repressor NrdR